MDYDHEEHTGNEKLYSRDVLKLLFKYVFSYKKYLFLALFFVFLITGANLAVPYLLKTLIDRYIFKQGKIVLLEGFSPSEESIIYRKGIRKGLKLSAEEYFLFQSQLKYFSEKEKDELINKGVLSKDTYVLIESPEMGEEVKKKTESLMAEGRIFAFENSIYLLNTTSLEDFKTEEYFQLRVKDFDHIVLYVSLIMAILLIQFGASYIQIIFLMKLSQYAMKDLRKDLFYHLLTLEVSYYEKNPIGRLVNRVTNDIETLNELFSSVLITLFQDILMMIGIMIVMFVTDLSLALVVAVTFPFIVLFTILFRIQVRNAYRNIRSRISELNGFLNETITGIRIIQIFVREIKNLKKFIMKNTAVFNAQFKLLYVNAVFRPLISFLNWFALATLIYFGARWIGQNRISFGLLIMFIAYIEKFFAPVQDLSEKFDIMLSATAAGEKIISVLKADAVREVDELHVSEGRKLTSVEILNNNDHRFRGEIIFDDVWFYYRPDEWVLRGVSFSVNPEETLAIVGETGAGKSTVISLLSRLYRIQKGRISIDGKNLDEIPYWLARRNIVSVMQDIFLFSRNVRDNIILGNLYQEDWFKKVSGITHIDRFIKSLPAKDQEPVMERGVTFSTGERQLLSFARALYFNPSILVLDEATSNIDTETEKLIQDAIQSITRGRTSIIIAHRLSTIRNADRIIVLEKGKIVEEGKHGELLQREGIYHKLYTLQFNSLG